MANIKQQKKRVRIAQRQRLENLRYRSTVRTLMRSLQDNVNLGDKDAAQKSFTELVSLLDRAATRRAMHPNTVARRKSRAARVLVSEPVKEAKVVRRAKKKTAPMRTSKKAKTAETEAAKAKAAEAKAAEAEQAAEATAAEENAPEAEAPAEDTPAERAAESDAPAEDESAEDAGK